MSSVIFKLFWGIVDFLFPSNCVNCETTISIRKNCLCDRCLNEIVFLDNRCEICSGSLFEGICVICSDRKLFITKNLSIAEYSGVIKEILYNYKFNKRKRLCLHLSKLAYCKIEEYRDAFDIITSVPINRRKRWERGFNQSELIAKKLAEILNKEYYSILRERSHFQIQKELGYRDRFLNVLDRYKVKNINYVKGKRVLIIDDIFTTGATINECARILISFGAVEIYSLTMARANIKRVASL